MTITRLEKEVPRSLPAVCLYLDDVEEITQVLIDCVSNTQPGRPWDRDAPIETKFSTDDKSCTEAQELLEIASSSRKLKIRVSKGTSKSVSVFVERFSYWSPYGLTDEEERATHRRLCAVFDARKLRSQNALRELVGDNSIAGVVLAMLGPFLVVGALTAFLTRRVAGPLGDLLSVSLSVILLSILGMFIFKSSRVVFRSSLDHAARREEQAWKIIPALLAGLIGLLAGLTIDYLKHKYWP